MDVSDAGFPKGNGMCEFLTPARCEQGQHITCTGQAACTVSGDVCCGHGSGFAVCEPKTECTASMGNIVCTGGAVCGNGNVCCEGAALGTYSCTPTCLPSELDGALAGH